ncbi:MAG: hypothetical protein GXP25_23810 [Planctomycetes bacterium]|nr:hypothetical protein [Planctomycetota bacterium]
MSKGSRWEQQRAWVGFVACWILIIVGLVFVIAGLTFCRSAIERSPDEFRYSFVPLFVLVSIGLILMLGGSMGMMHIEIAAHDDQVLQTLCRFEGRMNELLDKNAEGKEGEGGSEKQDGGG